MWWWHRVAQERSERQSSGSVEPDDSDKEECSKCGKIFLLVSVQNWLYEYRIGWSLWGECLTCQDPDEIEIEEDEQ